MRAYDWKKGRGGRGGLRGLGSGPVRHSEDAMFRFNEAEHAARKVGDLLAAGKCGSAYKALAKAREFAGGARTAWTSAEDWDGERGNSVPNEEEIRARRANADGILLRAEAVFLKGCLPPGKLEGAGNLAAHNNKAAVVAVALVGWLVYKKMKG